jgi:transcriptional regulator of arginine metabolism
MTSSTTPTGGVQDRRALIRSLLAEQHVTSQQDLLEHLDEHGVECTQPVLSRDLRAIGAAKQGGRYVILEEDRLTPLEALQPLLRDVARAGANLVVVRTEPGAASAVARALDAAPAAEIVGTVAGDDTIFVAVPSASAGRAITTQVQALL